MIHASRVILAVTKQPLSASQQTPNSQQRARGWRETTTSDGQLHPRNRQPDFARPFRPADERCETCPVIRA